MERNSLAAGSLGPGAFTVWWGSLPGQRTKTLQVGSTDPPKSGKDRNPQNASFANPISDEETVSRICKELSQLNLKTCKESE